jgi:hypothetical protein
MKLHSLVAFEVVEELSRRHSLSLHVLSSLPLYHLMGVVNPYSLPHQNE